MAKQYFNFIIIHKLLKSNEYISKTNEKDDNKKCKLFILNEKFLLYAFWEAGIAEAAMAGTPIVTDEEQQRSTFTS